MYTWKMHAAIVVFTLAFLLCIQGKTPTSLAYDDGLFFSFFSPDHNDRLSCNVCVRLVL